MGRTATDERIQTVCLLVIAAIAVGAALYWLRPVLLPLALAVVVHLGLTPIIDLLIRKCRVPRLLAIALAMLLAVGTLPLGAALVVTSVRRLASKADIYSEGFWRMTEQLGNRVPLLRPFVEAQNLSDRLSQLPVESILIDTTNTLVGITSNLVLVLIFAVFLLIGHRPLAPEHEGRLQGVLKRRVRRYLLTKVAISGCTGVLVALILAALRVDLWLVFGLAAFVLNFIPSVGSIISTLLPVPVALVGADSSLTTLALVLVIPGTIQFVLGNLIEPNLMGNSLDLHPVTVLVALIFWGSLWGVVGMLLAAPATAVLKIILEEVEITAPIARVMGGDRS